VIGIVAREREGEPENRDALNDGLRRSMRDQLPETFLWAMHERVRRDLRLVEDSAA